MAMQPPAEKTASDSVRVLVVEGDRADAESVENTLVQQTEGPTFLVERAATLQQMLSAMSNRNFDAILLDLRLPDSAGLATLATVLTAPSSAAVVVLASPEDELLALKAVKVGAQDYLVKGQVFGTMLARTIRHAIEHKLTEEAARNATDQARFQSTLLEAVAEAVIAIDLERRVTFWNRHAEVLFNWQACEVMAQKVFGFVCVPETKKKVAKLMDDVAQGHNWSGEVILRRRDHRLFPAFVTAAPIRSAAADIVGVVAAITDLTHIKELERSLQHAQRIDAIGRLASGVAHDFNNILTAVQGYSQLILEDMSPSDSAFHDVNEIHHASIRAAMLTRQLLAFSRKQVLQPQVVDVAKVVTGMMPMLRRLIGDDIDLTAVADAALGNIYADPGQIEQVVLNLVVNARDAMPKGGRIKIELRNVAIPDPMVLVQVIDEGTGIAPQALSHMYEPFFTTKEPGQGTGLGLSTVYGIVGQSGGFIEATNSPEGGAVFSVYLPTVDAEVSPRMKVIPRVVRGTGETILVVEEEAAVRSVVARMLIALDYKVLEASSGEKALESVDQHPGLIHLLLIDVNVRPVHGVQLARELQDLRPELRVLYMSGEPNDRVPPNVTAQSTILKKPFSLAELADAVHAARN